MICFDYDDVEILRGRIGGLARDEIVTKRGKRGGSVSRSLEKWEEFLGKDHMEFIIKSGASLRKAGAIDKYDLKSFPQALELNSTFQENHITLAEGLEFCKALSKVCKEEGVTAKDCIESVKDLAKIMAVEKNP
jgi:hypothetical protein